MLATLWPLGVFQASSTFFSWMSEENKAYEPLGEEVNAFKRTIFTRTPDTGGVESSQPALQPRLGPSPWFFISFPICNMRWLDYMILYKAPSRMSKWGNLEPSGLGHFWICETPVSQRWS